MLTCFYKKYLGIECPGCGMQRSALALWQGDIEKSLLLYPMLLPLAGMLAFLILHLKFKFEQGHKILLALFIFNSAGIVIHFLYKLLS